MSRQNTITITIGNSRLGFACAKALLTGSSPWHVVIACRDQGRTDISVEKLRKAMGAGAKDFASIAQLHEVSRRHTNC